MKYISLSAILCTTCLTNLCAAYTPRPTEAMSDMNPYSAFSTTTLPDMAESLSRLIQRRRLEKARNREQTTKSPAFTQPPSYRQVVNKAKKTAQSA